MALSESIVIPAHQNIYANSHERELKIEFSIPENGTNNETGIFLFVPGFGASIDSKIYKKMRNYFADYHNFVTVQCEYFGSKHMQNINDFRLKDSFDTIQHLFTQEELNEIYLDNSRALEILLKKDATLEVYANINETEEDFAELGFLQAIDLITAVEAIKIILKENDLVFDNNRVIGFGQSQGAYLLLLCNRMAPAMFSEIIDLSAWNRPEYLYIKRIVERRTDRLKLLIEYPYISSKILPDINALSIKNLYSNNFNNGAYIHSYLGIKDNLVNAQEKKDLMGQVNYCDLHIITEKYLDGEIFKSTGHGLDAHFIKFIEMILNKKTNHKNPNEEEINYEFISSRTLIQVDNSLSLPVFNVRLR